MENNRTSSKYYNENYSFSRVNIKKKIQPKKGIMKQFIQQIIEKETHSSGPEIYRNPIIGFADAQDPIFPELKKVISPEHLLPNDILADARSVLAFFIPFSKVIIDNNRSGSLSSRQWAEVYIQTNNLINRIYQELKILLSEQGVKMEAQPPTYFFDPDLLIASWSHKHVAYACGLGAFGYNHLLITKKGCGGRIGTAVLNIHLEPDSRPEKTHHCDHQTKHCHYCQVICPVQALGEYNFKRQQCYQQCQMIDHLYHDLDSCEVCGKCATGPCAYIE